MLDGQALDLVHVPNVGFLVHAVGNDVEQAAGEVDPHAVGQVQSEHGVAGADQCVVDRGVGLGAEVRLDVGEVRAEQFLDTLDGQGLDDVDFFAAARSSGGPGSLRLTCWSVPSPGPA